MAGLKSSTRGLLLAVCLVLVAPASALADCGTDVINDYLKDGTINGTYSVPCYQQALGEIPTDADIYTDIRASITAAMTKAGGLIAQRMSRKRKEAAGGDPPTGDTGTPETAG